MSATPYPLHHHAPSPTPPELLPLLKAVDGLVSPPGIYLRISELLRSPHSNAEDFAQVIACDPSLAARLLRIVNSSFYNFRSRIDEIHRAVAVIGMSNLYNMVLGVAAVRSFTRITTDLVNMDSFWRHSIYCGLIARALAQRCKVLHSERLFVSGLLHDIGTLVLFHQLPDVYRNLLLIADGNEQILYQAELETLGFSHAQAGGQLLKSWQVPETLHFAVNNHHAPLCMPEYCFDSSLVYIADRLANQSGIGAMFENSSEPDTQDIPAVYWQALGVDNDHVDCAEVVAEANLKFHETVTLLGLGARQI